MWDLAKDCEKDSRWDLGNPSRTDPGMVPQMGLEMDSSWELSLDPLKDPVMARVKLQ